MKVSKEFKVGLLVVLGLLLLFVGVNFLKGGPLFGKNREFYVNFANSSGLQVSNEVQLNGLKIGQVLSVGLHPDYADTILVKFSVDNEELLIPHGSSVELISSDILGTKALDLSLNSAYKAEIKYYKTGDTLKGSIAQSLEEQINEEILPLKKKTEELISSVDAIIVSVGTFWDTSAAYTIDESMNEVRYAVGTFGDLANNLSVLIKRETEMIDKILHDVGDITESLAGKSNEIGNTIDNISAITDTLKDSQIKATILETKNTLAELNDVLAKINNGEGSLGLLLHTDSLHNELIETNQSIQNLLNDMEANPKNYVHFSLFGRKKD